MRLGDVTTAAADLRRAYEAAVRTQDHPVIAVVGVSVAGLAAALRRPDLAARILGAAAALRGSDDATEVAIRQLTSELRDTLGTGFAAAYAEGRELRGDEAIAAVDPALVPPDPS